MIIYFVFLRVIILKFYKISHQKEYIKNIIKKYKKKNGKFLGQGSTKFIFFKNKKNISILSIFLNKFDMIQISK